MKKLVVLLLMVLPLCSVRASEWVEVEAFPETTSSTLEMKEEREYLWYKLYREGGFYEEAPSSDFIKTGLWKYSDWSNWTSSEVTGDRIETRTLYHYQDMKKIKYIRFSNMSSKHLVFDSITVFEGNEHVQYQLYEEEDSIIVELNNPMYYDVLEVSLMLHNEIDEENNYTMEWLYELDLPSCMRIDVLNFFDKDFEDTFYYRKMVPNEFLYEEEVTSYERVESNKHRLVHTTEESRYQNRLDYYEKETKLYFNEYSSVPIDDYLYPDWNTERVRLFVRENIKEVESCPICKECEASKEEVKVSPIVVTETVVESKDDKVLLELKQEIENLKTTIVSCTNEKSSQEEKNRVSETESLEEAPVIKKQSFEISFYFLFFVLGYLFGRIMPTKKKV